jgi:RimJ/RimL family protein N-acetyltransferase
VNLKLQLLKPEEIDMFNKADEEAFNVHARYFPEGIVPGAAEDDREEFNLETLLNDSNFTLLTIYDNDKFVGGAIVEDLGNSTREIVIFFLIVEYQSKGIGKKALKMVEDYFPETRIFRLITPSQVVRNAVFYVNKCGYHIVKVVDFDKEANTADYVFEKRR